MASKSAERRFGEIGAARCRYRFADSRSAQNWARSEGCAVPAAYRGR